MELDIQIVQLQDSIDPETWMTKYFETFEKAEKSARRLSIRSKRPVVFVFTFIDPVATGYVFPNQDWTSGPCKYYIVKETGRMYIDDDANGIEDCRYDLAGAYVYVAYCREATEAESARRRGIL